MFRQGCLTVAVAAAAVVGPIGGARAEGAPPCGVITRANLVSCVSRTSLTRQADTASLAAADGRIAATDPWFASSPTLALTGSRREGGEGSALNWSASLGVEVDLAGERGARRRAAVAERDAARSALSTSERADAGIAWHLYFDVLSAIETGRLLERLQATAERVWHAARAAAERGVASGLDADLAEATFVRVSVRRIEAEREAARARGELASMLGLASERQLEVRGALEPLAEAEQGRRSRNGDGPAATLFDAEARAHAARTQAWRRSRVPNPTLSVVVARDGFDENVLGVGLAFPLPLPEPLGHLRAGEIAESEALARRARLLAANSRRKLRADWLAAVTEYEAARAAARVHSPERVQRAEAGLGSLTREVEAGRIGTKEAVMMQEPLLELLLGSLSARKSLCHASVEVVRTAGQRLDAGSTP